MKSMKRPSPGSGVLLLLLLGIIIFGYLSLGVFITQPIGTRSKGVTIIYLRWGMRIPFVSYAFIREPENTSLSAEMTVVAKPIINRKIILLHYVPGLYFLSPTLKDLQNNFGSAAVNQPLTTTPYDPNSPRCQKSLDTMITYFFIGHSNMGGTALKWTSSRCRMSGFIVP
ncbi:MAG TPA: hypothetical protein VLX68_14190 [Chitinivibrionales bacterium]|nr:hypothetical protein [Chitinivibrionales bacterium]